MRLELRRVGAVISFRLSFFSLCVCALSFTHALETLHGQRSIDIPFLMSPMPTKTDAGHAHMHTDATAIESTIRAVGQGVHGGSHGSRGVSL